MQKSSLNVTVAVLAIASSIAVCATPDDSAFVAESGLTSHEQTQLRKLIATDMMVADFTKTISDKADIFGVAVNHLDMASLFDGDDRTTSQVTSVILDQDHIELVTSSNYENLVDAVYADALEQMRLLYEDPGLITAIDRYVSTGNFDIELLSLQTRQQLWSVDEDAVDTATTTTAGQTRTESRQTEAA